MAAPIHLLRNRPMLELAPLLVSALILGLLSGIGPLCTDFYLPALPEITQQLQATSTQTQLSLTAALIGLGLGQLFFGPLSDRIGRLKPLALAIAMLLQAGGTQAQQPFSGAWFAGKGAQQGTAAATGRLPNGQPATSLNNPLLQQQKAEGKDPVFHPEKLGIKNADYWSGHTSEDNLSAEKAEAQQPQR